MVARVVVSAQWMQDNVLWPTATLGLASDQLRVSVSHALIVAWVMTGALLLVALARHTPRVNSGQVSVCECRSRVAWQY